MAKPSVYIGVPTGFPKEYSTLYMLASLRNIDYPPDQLHLTFSVTLIHDHDESQRFRHNLQQLIDASNIPYPTRIIETWVTEADMERWGSYFGVIINLHHLRLDFLQGDWQYFWLLGGDNPPADRTTLKKLVRRRGDVVSAMIRQRPGRGKFGKPYPVLWGNYWYLQDIPRDIEPFLRDELRKAWVEFAFLKQWDNLEPTETLRDVSFGSGCSLIKREVLEYIGYTLGLAGMHSEDLHFCQLARLHGFETKCDLNIRCAHFDPDGLVY